MLIIFTIIAYMLIGAGVLSEARSNGRSYDARRRSYIVSVCVILALQSGLRAVSIGADTVAYENKFNVMRVTSWDYLRSMVVNYFFEGNTGSYKDPGYECLEKLFTMTGLDYRVWLIFVAVVFFSAFGYFLYKNGSRISDACFAFILYMIIYYGFYSVTGIRQTLAMAVCLWAFELAKRRKLVAYLVLVLLASTIHKSALLFLPAYLLIDFKYPKALIGASVCALPIVYMLRFQIVTFFGDVMGYEDYAVGYEGAGAYGYAFCAIVAAVIVWWKTDEVVSSAKGMRTAISLFAVSTSIIPALWVDPSIMRVAQYYSIFILLVFPHALRVVDREFAGRSSLSSRGRRRVDKGKLVANDVSGSKELGRVYVLCFIFLLAYCAYRFWGYEYMFFFM